MTLKVIVLQYHLFFCFSGVKLDLKSCEAMEEVFKKVQFFTLDIENTNLEDEV